MSPPAVPLAANVLGTSLTARAELKGLLVDQVTGQVRWKTSVEWMVAQGVSEFWEIGAGKALSGMIRRISKDAVSRAIGTPDDIKAAVNA